MSKIYEKLEQMDYVDGEYFEKVEVKYSQLIGSFIINFSNLDHDLNCAIADSLHEDCHENGYVIIEKLTAHNKIDLFYKFYVRLESFKDKKTKIKLDEIKSELLRINAFRNNIVHANWQTLNKKGFVRTKIVVDAEEGYVKFQNIQITPKIIRDNVKAIHRLINKIERYTERAFNF